MTVWAAIGRGDIAQYVDAIFIVYIALILIRIVLGWIQLVRPLPYNTTLRAVTGFVEETTEPYLGLFRRVLPPIGGGGMGLDLSPMVGLIVLFVARAVVVGLIEG